MTRLTSIILGALMTVLTAEGAAGQWNVARYDTDANRTYATYGFDPAFVATLGYGRVVPVWGHAVQLTGEAGIATAHMDLGDYRLRAGIRTSVARWRSVHLTGSLAAIARGTDNVLYRGFGWGADVTGTLGVYRPRWFAAAELGKDKAIVTHITHSDWYRTHYYPDAKDGWYLDAGGSFHYGLTAGLALGKVELAGRAGLMTTEDFNDMTPPMYASLGVGIAH
jgi:hypothetical protein